MAPAAASTSSVSNGFNDTASGSSPVLTATSATVIDSARLGGKTDVNGDGFIRLSSLTHDTFVATEHTCMQRLGEDLQSAAKAVFPKQEGNRYSRVCVLLLSWVTDDLGVASEVQRLRHVFEDIYRFQVQTYQIPDEKPDRALKSRILQFLTEDKDDNLLIFYYAGHARRGPQSNDGPLWFPNRQNPLITVPCAGIQTLLEETDSDVLLLYDCCHSAAVATTGCYLGDKGVKEVISACGYETVAPEVDEHSFTNALIETFALASKGTPFSIGELHSRVLSRLKCWTPSLLYSENGKILKTADGKLAHEKQPRRTPIYSILRESKSRRSIVLAPLNHVQCTPEREGQQVPITTPATSYAGLGLHSDTEAPKWPQVLLSIRLDEAELEIPTWREWIRSLPAEARDIKIEGIYKSFSTLLLIRMPVSVWNLLPNNSAYSFVGYVTSGNRAILRDSEPEQLIKKAGLEEAQATGAEESHKVALSAPQAPATTRMESFSKPQELGLTISLFKGGYANAVGSNESVFSTESNDEEVFSNIFSGDSMFSSSTRPTSSHSQLHPLSSIQPSQRFSESSESRTLSIRTGGVRVKYVDACVPCQMGLFPCNKERPCYRCIMRGKQDICLGLLHEETGGL